MTHTAKRQSHIQYLTVGLHVIMKQTDWQRFKGHTLNQTNDRILIDGDDGKTYIIEVREATGGEEPFDPELLEATIAELSRPIFNWRRARGLLAGMRNEVDPRKIKMEIGAIKRRRNALLEIHNMIMSYARR
jgi:hypothetical protein